MRSFSLVIIFLLHTCAAWKLAAKRFVAIVSVSLACGAAAPVLAVPQTAEWEKTILEQREIDRPVEKEDNAISLTVPSRPTIIALPDEAAVSKEGDVDSFEEVLKLIPSWKYFKIIAKEYSSRSTNYQEGKENLFSPFQ